MDGEMHFGSGGMKLKFTADVEWFEKMDVSPEAVGYYAYLYLNRHQVQSWKLTKLDMLTVFNERPNPAITGSEARMLRSIDKDGLAEFIAAKLGDLFTSVFYHEHGE